VTPQTSDRYQQVEAAARARIASATAQKQRRRVDKAYDDDKPAMAEPDPERRINRVKAVAGVSTEQARELLTGQKPTTSLSGDERFGAERLLHVTANYLPASFLPAGQLATSAVARVLRRNNIPVGSGFLISPRLFLTNNHVIGSAEDARGMLLEFDYETDLQGNPRPPTRFALDPDACFVTNEEDDLDYTVVAVGERVFGGRPLTAFGFCPLSDAGDKHMLGEFVNIVQHPQGNPKQVVVRENKLVTRLENVLHYVADTEPGSSGSPVFNDEWETVALHHWGEPHREKAGPDGKTLSSMVNEGIRISAIVGNLKEELLPKLARGMQALVNEALPGDKAVRPVAQGPTGVPDVPDGKPRKSEAISGNGAAAPVARVGPARVNADGSVTFTLEVNVNLVGGPGAPGEALLPRREAIGIGGVIPAPGTAVPSFSVDSLSATRFDWRTAYSTALACNLAYSSADDIQRQASAWGLSECRFVPGSSTQAFVVATADTTLVSFRGTANASNWVSDINLFYTQRPYGKVHRGFYFALREVEDGVRAAVAQLNRPRLVITGHSLGGAMAALFAAETPGDLSTAWIYTYGQPRTGFDAFVTTMTNRFGDRLVRVVNNNDIVPQVPPLPFRHVGRLLQFDGSGNVSGSAEALAVSPAPSDDPPPLSTEQFLTLQNQMQTGQAAAVAGAEGLFPSFSDHRIAEYIRKIRGKL
jgi:V8-like Glu-specific endopeptidase